MQRDAYLTAAYLGVIAGMRTMAAPAFVSDYLIRMRPEEFEDSRLSFMGSGAASALLRLSAASEMAADKSSSMPDRISPGPLAARIISGSLCGASICVAEKKRVEIGAMVGGLAAAVSAFAFFHMRRKLTESEGIPDGTIALCEDAAVIAAGMVVLR